MKTKNKLDQLKLVMQQKKERREARKLKIAPYNTPSGSLVSLPSVSPSTTVLVPVMPATSSEMNGSLMTTNVTNHLNDSTDASSSSSATATAIATSISTNNSEIENHLEEVDTVA
jgi:hypothetical protein